MCTHVASVTMFGHEAALNFLVSSLVHVPTGSTNGVALVRIVIRDSVQI